VGEYIATELPSIVATSDVTENENNKFYPQPSEMALRISRIGCWFVEFSGTDYPKSPRYF
jgi:hypothetical protein